MPTTRCELHLPPCRCAEKKAAFKVWSQQTGWKKARRRWRCIFVLLDPEHRCNRCDWAAGQLRLRQCIDVDHEILVEKDGQYGLLTQPYNGHFDWPLAPYGLGTRAYVITAADLNLWMPTPVIPKTGTHAGTHTGTLDSTAI